MDMRRKLSLADDKLLISYKDEDEELYISQSIERVLKYIERDRIMRNIERGDVLEFNMRKYGVKWIERDNKLAYKIEDVVEMIEEAAISFTENRTDYH